MFSTKIIDWQNSLSHQTFLHIFDQMNNFSWRHWCAFKKKSCLKVRSRHFPNSNHFLLWKTNQGWKVRLFEWVQVTLTSQAKKVKWCHPKGTSTLKGTPHFSAYLIWLILSHFHKFLRGCKLHLLWKMTSEVFKWHFYFSYLKRL